MAWEAYLIKINIHFLSIAIDDDDKESLKSQTFIFPLDLSGYFLKKSWFRSYRIFLRSSGFFWRQQSKKFYAYGEMLVYEGITTFSLTILIKSSSWTILNGFSPISISYISTPKDQISILSSYKFPFKISGHIYSGVPQKVLRNFSSWWTDQPKSQSLTTFSWITIFYGLISRWIIWFECS